MVSPSLTSTVKVCSLPLSLLPKLKVSVPASSLLLKPSAPEYTRVFFSVLASWVTARSNEVLLMSLSAESENTLALLLWVVEILWDLKACESSVIAVTLLWKLERALFKVDTPESSMVLAFDLAVVWRVTWDFLSLTNCSTMELKSLPEATPSEVIEDAMFFVSARQAQLMRFYLLPVLSVPGAPRFNARGGFFPGFCLSLMFSVLEQA